MLVMPEKCPAAWWPPVHSLPGAGEQVAQKLLHCRPLSRHQARLQCSSLAARICVTPICKTGSAWHCASGVPAVWTGLSVRPCWLAAATVRRKGCLFVDLAAARVPSRTAMQPVQLHACACLPAGLAAARAPSASALQPSTAASTCLLATCCGRRSRADQSRARSWRPP